jgi:hypothetical protein
MAGNEKTAVVRADLREVNEVFASPSAARRNVDGNGSIGEAIAMSRPQAEATPDAARWWRAYQLAEEP